MSRFGGRCHILQNGASPSVQALMMIRTAELVALVYFLYLTGVGVIRGPVRAAVTSAGALIVLAGIESVWALVDTPVWLQAARDGWPLVLLFIGYRLSGLFYARPDADLERRLLRVDHRIAGWAVRLLRAGGASGATSSFESAYLTVYPLIPAGALTIALVAPEGAVDRFWTVVLVAGFACYGALPWIQTRPPRCLDATWTCPDGVIRRLNLAILERGSVAVNTLPSGHAATAVATALVVLSHTPAIGAVFLIVAIGIAIATVVGRYHYAVDTILGVLVAVMVWLLVPR